MKNELTERQHEILNFIQQYVGVKGFPPSFREIGKQFGIASTFGVKRHIDALVKKGFISNESKTSRTLSVLGEAVNKSKRLLDNLIELPIIGRVAAGHPILAEENIEGNFMVDSNMLKNKNSCFGLKVRGDSMINAGIFDGDLVLVRPQHEAPTGAIVVALVDGDATVKRFERGNGHVRLVAENPAYEPIVTSNVSLVGVVRGVIRLFR